MSTVLAAFFGVVVGVHGLSDLSHAAGHPSERATIVDAVRVSGVCGGRRLTPRYDVIWRSLDPPTGLAATFTQKGACTDSGVGDTHRVVRVTHPDGTLSVYLDPPVDAGAAVLTALEVFAGVLAFGTVTFGLIDRYLGRGAAFRRNRAPAS